MTGTGLRVALLAAAVIMIAAATDGEPTMNGTCAMGVAWSRWQWSETRG